MGPKPFPVMGALWHCFSLPQIPMAPNRYPKRSQLHAFMAAEQGMMLGSMRSAGMDRSRARPWSQVPGRAVDFLICGSRPTNGIIDDY